MDKETRKVEISGISAHIQDPECNPGTSKIQIGDAIVPSVLNWDIIFDEKNLWPVLSLKIMLEPNVRVNINDKDMIK